jgi:hypothetical protein
LIHALVRPRCERGWPQDACDCILATCRVIQQAESFSHERACSILRRRLQRPPRTFFMQWGGEVSHASVLRRVRCGQVSFVACRLASSGDVRDDAATSLLWAHFIIARVHFHHRRQMLETLVGVKKSVVYNGYAYRSLAGHDPHSKTVIEEWGFYSVDPPWELCPDTCDARHVCATYPWATFALVFADGFACWTKKGLDVGPSSSNSVQSPTFLKQFEGKYGANHIADQHVDPMGDPFYDCTYHRPAAVLLRRRLPY